MPLVHAPDPRKKPRKQGKKEDETERLATAHELTVLQYQKLRFKVRSRCEAQSVAQLGRCRKVCACGCARPHA